MQVLIADDDPVYRNLLQTLLEQWHFTVASACDGAQAWSILQQPNAPRLVLLDWMMPQIDGYEVCQLVRANKSKDDTFILLMTGSRKREEVMKVLVAGADDYLMKPFEPTDLKIHLRLAVRILGLQDELRSVRDKPLVTS